MHNWPLQRVGLATAALGVACAVLVALAPHAVAIVPPRDCGTLTVHGQRYSIKADQLGCRTARSHASRYLADRRRPRGYRCRNYGRETRLKFRCASEVKVFFAIRR